MICLAAFKQAARCLALVALVMYREKSTIESEKVGVSLRKKSTCFGHVTDQVPLYAVKYFILLWHMNFCLCITERNGLAFATMLENVIAK